METIAQPNYHLLVNSSLCMRNQKTEPTSRLKNHQQLVAILVDYIRVKGERKYFYCTVDTEGDAWI
jgi:transposase-like protein